MMAYDPMHLVCPSFNLSAAKSTASASYSIKLSAITMSIKLTLLPGHVVHHHPRSALPPRAADPLAHRQQHHHGHRGHRHGAAFACWVTSFSSSLLTLKSLTPFPAFPEFAAAAHRKEHEVRRCGRLRWNWLDLVVKLRTLPPRPRSRGDALGRAAPGFS